MTITGILLDVEGTTTPIDYVYKILFPYAHAHMEAFLGEHLSDEEIRAAVASLREEHAADEQQGCNPPPLRNQSKEEELGSIVAYIHWLMDRDRKSTPLKTIQGGVWQYGYRSGELRSQVFGDVPAAFERWHKQKKEIRIFSSGSVLAQKLLFANTEAGDLTKLISGYFDTRIGAKGDAESYRRISNAFGLAASEILFISDVTEELNAACSANMQTRLCLRPGNRPQPPGSNHPTIRSFDELFSEHL
ncbi:MAG TPA: acireductone synthase [Blastocatellia bacterium]|nr:acireductone synthase [Blastocatellia bacterium]